MQVSCLYQCLQTVSQQSGQVIYIRGLTVYSEQSLFPHLFIIVLTYHALSPLFLTAWIYISHTSSIDTYISITLQRKKSSCDFCGNNKEIVALFSTASNPQLPQTSSTSLAPQRRPSPAVAENNHSAHPAHRLYPDHCRMASCQTLHHYLARYEDQIKEITLNDLVPKGSHPQNLNRHTCDLSYGLFRQFWIELSATFDTL